MYWTTVGWSARGGRDEKRQKSSPSAAVVMSSLTGSLQQLLDYRTVRVVVQERGELLLGAREGGRELSTRAVELRTELSNERGQL